MELDSKRDLETTLDFPNDKSLEGNNGSFISLMLLLYREDRYPSGAPK